MTRRAAPQLGVDRMASTSWSGKPAVKPLAHQGRASARGLEGRPTLQHPYASDQTGWKSRCRASFSLAIKHGIYREVGHAVAGDEIGVINSIRALAAAGVISRLGCIVRHRSLGYTANAMAVWDVPDTTVDAVAARMVVNSRVTLCYRRRRSPPDWPYNLFCMVHAKSRAEALAIVDDLNAIADASYSDRAVLFSTRCFKQRGAVFSRLGLAASGRLN